MNRLTLVVLAGIVLGGITGLLAPSAEAITISYSLRVHPGATNSMTCGWHEGGCPSNPGGTALDWDNADYGTVYWRSFGWCSYGPCTTIATGVISLNTPFCTETHVALTDNYGRSQQKIIYTHTTTSQGGQSFGVSGSTSWAWKQTGIGSSLTSEIGGCPFGGSHTHQKYGGTGWTKNSLYPNAPATGTYTVTSFGNHQFLRGWSFTF